MFQIENLLTSNEWGKLLDDEFINSLDKSANYSFLEKHIAHENEDVRNLTLTFCHQLMPSNAFNVFIVGLNDENDQNVNRAAWGIFDLSPKDRKNEIINKIKILVPKFNEGITPSFIKLVLTIGKIGDNDDIKNIAKMLMPLNKDEINESLLWASAKTGDSLSIEKIKLTLKVGSIEEKEKTLNGVKYINNTNFIKDITPILLDKRVVEIEYRGDSDKVLYQVRLCDRAITALLKIDVENKTLKSSQLDTYSDEDLEKMMKYYSISKESL